MRDLFGQTIEPQSIPRRQPVRGPGHSADANAVLFDFEDELAKRFTEDDTIDHELAGRLSDHAMLAADVVRRRHRLEANLHG